MKSDAWATALMILGEKEGLRLAKANKIKIFMIIRDGARFRSVMTEGFKPYLVKRCYGTDCSYSNFRISNRRYECWLYIHEQTNRRKLWWTEQPRW